MWKRLHSSAQAQGRPSSGQEERSQNKTRKPKETAKVPKILEQAQYRQAEPQSTAYASSSTLQPQVYRRQR